MAIILVRNRFSNEGMKGLVDRRGDDNREVATRNAFKLIGVELKSWYFSTEDASAVLVVEGDAKKIPLIEAWALASGVFTQAHAEVLIPVSEFSEALGELSQVLARMTPPTVTKSTACSSTNDHHPNLECGT